MRDPVITHVESFVHAIISSNVDSSASSYFSNHNRQVIYLELWKDV